MQIMQPTAVPVVHQPTITIAAATAVPLFGGVNLHTTYVNPAIVNKIRRTAQVSQVLFLYSIFVMIVDSAISFFTEGAEAAMWTLVGRLVGCAIIGCTAYCGYVGATMNDPVVIHRGGHDAHGISCLDCFGGWMLCNACCSACNVCCIVLFGIPFLVLAYSNCGDSCNFQHFVVIRYVLDFIWLCIFCVAAHCATDLRRDVMARIVGVNPHGFNQHLSHELSMMGTNPSHQAPPGQQPMMSMHPVTGMPTQGQIVSMQGGGGGMQGGVVHGGVVQGSLRMDIPPGQVKSLTVPL
jgi:hypothetical protein